MPVESFQPDQPAPAPDATVCVQNKAKWGQARLYPICERAQLFARIIGRETIPNNALPLIRALGYELIAVDANKNPLGRWID